MSTRLTYTDMYSPSTGRGGTELQPSSPPVGVVLVLAIFMQTKLPSTRAACKPSSLAQGQCWCWLYSCRPSSLAQGQCWSWLYSGSLAQGQCWFGYIHADQAPWHKGSAICMKTKLPSTGAVLVLIILMQTKLPGTGAVLVLSILMQTKLPGTGAVLVRRQT